MYFTMKRGLVVFVVLSLVCSVSAVEYPRLSGFVSDNADMFSPEWEAKITALAREIEKNTTAEFAVVTVSSLDGLSIEQYAVELFEREGIGKKDKDNGLLILIAEQDRAYRVEVGYGLEAYITDSLKVSVGRDIMEYNFKQGEFGRGVFEAMDAMYGLILDNPDVLSKYQMQYSNAGEENPLFNFLFFIFVLYLFSRLSGGHFLFIPFFFPAPRSRGGYGGFGGGFGGFGGGMSGGGGFSGRW